MGVLLVLAVVLAVVGRLEASSEVSPLGFMDHLMSVKGCGSFAGLVNATANATETFQRSLAHGGLVVFCPDDTAVAAFDPWFNDLGADGQLAVLLYHGVAPASLRDRRVLTGPTLATDLANRRGYGLTIRHRGDAMELLPSSWGVARVTRTVTGEEEPLVIYLIDAVLLPRESTNDGDSSFDELPPWLWLDLRVQAVLLYMVCYVITH